MLHMVWYGPAYCSHWCSDSWPVDPLLCVSFNSASLPPWFAVGPNRTKLVTPNSSLKFTPEELVLYCRDLRVVCFLFDRLTPDAQVLEVCVFFLFLSPQIKALVAVILVICRLLCTSDLTLRGIDVEIEWPLSCWWALCGFPPQITYTIAKTYQPPKPGSVLSFQNAALGSVGE